MAWSRQFPDDELAGILPGKTTVNSVDTASPEFETYSTVLRPQGVAAALGTRRAFKDFNPDIFVGHNFTPLAGKKGVKLTYLHDLMFMDHPEWFTRAEGAYFRGMPILARFADVVLASTEAEAERIRRFVSTPVQAVGLGLSRELANAEPDERVARKLELTPKKFILAVGRLNTRKNLNAAIAGALASGAVTVGNPLVVVGAADGKQTKVSFEAQVGINNRSVRFAGQVSDAELAWLYKNARLLVFVSHDEGFGMPPVEAGYFGTPSVVSDLPVFHETLHGHAIYVDQRRIEDIATGIKCLAEGQIRLPPPEWWSDTHSWDVSVGKIRQIAEARL